MNITHPLKILVFGGSNHKPEMVSLLAASRCFVQYVIYHDDRLEKLIAAALDVDVALLLIDSSEYVTALPFATQLKQCLLICSILGIRQFVLLPTDLVGQGEANYHQLILSLQDYLAQLPDTTFCTVPYVKPSSHPGQPGGSFSHAKLEDALGTFMPRQALVEEPLRLRIDQRYKQNEVITTLLAGQVQPGQEVRVLASGVVIRVVRASAVQVDTTSLQATRESQFLGLLPRFRIVLETDVDVVAGNFVVAARSPCGVSDQFSAHIIWLGNEEGFVGRSYGLNLGSLNLGTGQILATIVEIKYIYNIENLERLSGKQLTAHSIGEVVLSLEKPIPFDAFENVRAMGLLTLSGRYSPDTVGVALIRFALHRAENVHRQTLTVGKSARALLNGHQGRVLWFTGLSGSGKSTLANEVEQVLHQQGAHTYILDGDNIRQGLNKDLGFTNADRVENIRRIAEVAKLMVDAGLVVLTAFISPFRSEREMARNLFDTSEFMEIYVDVPLDVAENRDPKGLYRKARMGQLPNFTGIDSAYEAPEQPEVWVKTAQQPIQDCISQILESL